MPETAALLGVDPTEPKAKPMPRRRSAFRRRPPSAARPARQSGVPCAVSPTSPASLRAPSPAGRSGHAPRRSGSRRRRRARDRRRRKRSGLPVRSAQQPADRSRAAVRDEGVDHRLSRVTTSTTWPCASSHRPGSEISTTSSMRCETKMNDARVVSSRIRLKSSCTSSLLRTEVGSSSRMTRTPFTRSSPPETIKFQ